LFNPMELSTTESRWAVPDRDSAIAWCRMRNDNEIRCLLDPLGRYSRTDEQMRTAVNEHTALAEAIARSKIDASMSIKLTTLGGTLNRELAMRNALFICQRCAELGVGFEIDMEGQRMVNLTLETAERCANIAPVTLALQAYLDRTHQDLERMLDAGVRVRLVKGAYSGNISDFEMIQEVYKDLTEEVLKRDVPFCVATHDPELLSWMKGRCRDKEMIEFGFLKGLSDQTKQDLAAEGWKVVEYVPYGSNTEGYITRRRTYLMRLEELGRMPAP